MTQLLTWQRGSTLVMGCSTLGRLASAMSRGSRLGALPSVKDLLVRSAHGPSLA